MFRVARRVGLAFVALAAGASAAESGRLGQRAGFGPARPEPVQLGPPGPGFQEGWVLCPLREPVCIVEAPGLPVSVCRTDPRLQPGAACACLAQDGAPINGRVAAGLCPVPD